MTAREEKSLTKVVVNHGNNMKKNLINHGLPEHPWCPPVSSGGAKNQDHHGATKVINVNLAFCPLIIVKGKISKKFDLR